MSTADEPVPITLWITPPRACSSDLPLATKLKRPSITASAAIVTEESSRASTATKNSFGFNPPSIKNVEGVRDQFFLAPHDGEVASDEGAVLNCFLVRPSVDGVGLVLGGAVFVCGSDEVFEVGAIKAASNEDHSLILLSRAPERDGLQVRDGIERKHPFDGLEFVFMFFLDGADDVLPHG